MHPSDWRMGSCARLLCFLAAILGWTACRESQEKTQQQAMVAVKPQRRSQALVPGGIVKVNAAALRKQATVKPMPTYPPRSLATGVTGVVVAEVTAAADGKVRAVDIVEAPDTEIGVAVRTALTQWRFSPVRVVGEAEARPVFATLVFYFVISNGKGMVLTPEEAPAAGRPPEAPDARQQRD